MFAVPKDTQTLIFTISFADYVTKDKIEMLENGLTKKIGIPCIVLDRNFRALETDEDFHVECNVLPKQGQEPASQPGPVLDQKPGEEGDGSNDCLNNRGLISLFRDSKLFLLGLLLCGIAFFVFGVLCSYLLRRIFIG